MRIAFLLILCLLARSAGAMDLRTKLQCQLKGKAWEITTPGTSRLIGVALHGVPTQDNCESLLQYGGLHSVCTWTNSGFEPTSIDTGLPISVKNSGFSTFMDCGSATENDYGGVVCDWNGSNYEPFYSGSGHPVGRAGVGLNSLDHCLAVSRAAINQVVCNWNGSNYSAYDKETGKAVKTFPDLDSCVAFSTTPSALNPSRIQWVSTAGQVSGCTITDVSYGKPTTQTLARAECETRVRMTFKISDDNTQCLETTPDGVAFGAPALDVCIAHATNVQTLRLKGASSCIYLIDNSRVVPVQNADACAAAVDEYDPVTHAVQLAGPARWTGDRGDECAEFLPDPKTGALTYAHKVANSNCFLPSLTFFQWRDASSNSCVAYSACGVSVGIVDAKFCAGKTNRFALKWPAKGYTWSSCVDTSGVGATIPFDKNNKFLPQCAPDALYAWHSWDRIQAVVEAHQTSSVLSFGSNRFFLWRTPVGSFGYGNALMRLKLKAGVHFVRVDFADRDCAKLGKTHDIQNTVFVDRAPDVGNGNFSEYVMCSTGPVESWSTDMPQNADEMAREYDWILNHAQSATVNFDSLSGTNLDNSLPWAIDQNWDSGFGHTNDWSQGALVSNIQHAQKDSGLGQVFFDKSAVPSLWNHFATVHPGYFDPYDSTAPNGALETWPERDAQACLPH